MHGVGYYRYARAVSDIAYEGEQVFSRPDLGPDSRHTAVERFMNAFRSGGNVSQALESDEHMGRSAALWMKSQELQGR